MPKKIYNEQEKYDLIQKIPKRLFLRIFGGDLSNFDMQFLNITIKNDFMANDDKLSDRIYHQLQQYLMQQYKTDLELFSNSDNAKLWTSLIIANHKLSGLMFVKLGGMLHLDPSSMLAIATELGRGDITRKLQHMHPTYYFLKMIKNADYHVLRVSIQSEERLSFSFLTAFLDLLFKNENLANLYEPLVHVFGQACSKGYITIVNYIATKLIEIKAYDTLLNLIAAKGFYSFRVAVSHNHLPTAKALVEYAPSQIQNMILAEGCDVFYRAIENGHLQMIYQLIKWSPETVGHLFTHLKIMGLSRVVPHVDAFNFIHYLMQKLDDNQMYELLESQDFQVFKVAAQKGKPRVLRQLILCAMYLQIPEEAYLNDRKPQNFDSKYQSRAEFQQPSLTFFQSEPGTLDCSNCDGELIKDFFKTGLLN